MKTEEFNKVTMHCTKEGENYMSISFFPYEGSTDLQAERKLWSFGHDLGLTEGKCACAFATGRKPGMEQEND